MGYGRAPFIWLLAIADGSMKLLGSYMPFCGDAWKSMARKLRLADGLLSAQRRRKCELVWEMDEREEAGCRDEGEVE